MERAESNPGVIKRFCGIGIFTSLLAAAGLFAASKAATGGCLPGIGYALGAIGSLLWTVTLLGIYLFQDSREESPLLRLAELLLAVAPSVAVIATEATATMGGILLAIYLGVGFGNLIIAYGAYCIAENRTNDAPGWGKLALGVVLLGAGAAGFVFFLG